MKPEKYQELYELIDLETEDLSPIAHETFREKLIPWLLDNFSFRTNGHLKGNLKSLDKKELISMASDISLGSLGLFSMFLLIKARKELDTGKLEKDIDEFALLFDETNCYACGEKIQWLINFEDMVIKVNKDKCVYKPEYDNIKSTFESKSGKIVFANDLRVFVESEFESAMKKVVSDTGASRFSLEYDYERHLLSKYLLDKNIVFVSATSSEMCLVEKKSMFISKDESKKGKTTRIETSGFWGRMALDYAVVEDYLKNNSTDKKARSILDKSLVVDLEKGIHDIELNIVDTEKNFTINKKTP